MRLFCYKAKCGDAFHLQYIGKSGVRHNIFLDMGFAITYDSIIKPVIISLNEKSECLDAIFLSHIHNDHIGGANKFINDIKNDKSLNGLVKRWVYNAPRKYEFSNDGNYTDGAECGIISGDKIYEFISSNNPSDLMDYVTGCSFEIDGMRVILVSPNTDKLEILRNKYANGRPLCIEETNEISAEAGAFEDDYHIPLPELDIGSFTEDSSIENSSSIAAIFEYNEKRILWLADSIPSVVENSLVQMGFSETNRMKCDAVILSHHGSSSNNSATLFRMIDSDKYIISADGVNRYCLPHKITVARVIAASSNPVSIYFNYCDGRLPRMFAIDNENANINMMNIIYLHDCEGIEL